MRVCVCIVLFVCVCVLGLQLDLPVFRWFVPPAEIYVRMFIVEFIRFDLLCLQHSLAISFALPSPSLTSRHILGGSQSSRRRV